jgi:2-succinyl-6-hydroxy-2,4-cyclohexadiene-1-carboxylate synthase
MSTAHADPQVRFVEAAGARLRAVVEGRGRPVLALHGFTGDAESMEGVSIGLRDRHRVVRLELLGHGESDAPRDPSCYSMSACSAQVLAASQALGLERPHLLGYSMGGRAALATAIAAPDAFASVVLVGATAGLEDPAQREARIASDRALADRIEDEGVERFVEEWMALPLFASQARLGPAALARARAQRLRNRAHGLAASLRGMGTGAQPPLHARLSGLALPVLLVVGDEDAKFREIARALEAELPDARTRLLPEAGHAPHLEAPEAFAGVVGEFLSEVDASGSVASSSSIRRGDAAGNEA